jgi:hypothetical protein
MYCSKHSSNLLNLGRPSKNSACHLAAGVFLSQKIGNVLVYDDPDFSVLNDIRLLGTNTGLYFI